MAVLRRCLTCRALPAAGSYCVAHKKPGRGGSTRRWRDVREVVLRRDDHRCRSCGAGGAGLEIHHLTPVVRGGTDRAANLVRSATPATPGHRPAMETRRPRRRCLTQPR